jgi:hypothetical protein
MEYIEKNHFTLYDNEMADARKEKGYYYMEENFSVIYFLLHENIFQIYRILFLYLDDLLILEFLRDNIKTNLVFWLMNLCQCF